MYDIRMELYIILKTQDVKSNSGLGRLVHRIQNVSLHQAVFERLDTYARTVLNTQCHRSVSLKIHPRRAIKRVYPKVTHVHQEGYTTYLGNKM